MNWLVAQCRTHAVLILASLLGGMVLAFTGYVASTAGTVYDANHPRCEMRP